MRGILYTTATLAVLTSFASACKSTDDPVSVDSVALAGKGGNGGGGGGGGGGEGADAASMSGGMVAAQQPVTITQDSKRTLQVDAASYAVDVNLGGAYTDAPSCLFEPSDLTPELQNELVGMLSASYTAELTVLVDKRSLGVPSSDNMIRLAAGSDGLVQVGRNNDRIGAGFPLVTLVTDGNTRHFTFEGGSGDVRVARRHDADGDGLDASDPVHHLTCPLNTDITVTMFDG